MAETKNKLFSEFPPISTQAWTDKIISDLKGASFEKKLMWKTAEGIDANPFYTAEDLKGLAAIDTLPGEFPYMRGTKTTNSWLIRQDMEVDDCSSANEKAKRLIATDGVTSLGFHLKRDMVKEENIMLLLDGICPEKTELNFNTCNRKSATLLKLLADYFRTKQVDLSACTGSVGFDPFKKPLIKGVTIDDDWVQEAVAVVKACEALPAYSVLAVNAYRLNDAGSSITQEAGYALANGSELIAKLSEAGVPVGKIAEKIKFNFGITANYFLEISKFRATRWLWAEIVKAWNTNCGHTEDDGCTTACKMKVHARTSEWNMTVYDAFVNLLRTQSEAMSAALAGVDSMTVLPFDYAFAKPDEFSERIARNQQLLLKEECHFGKVVDPTAGSYYVEVLTQSLAEATWKLFLEVEEQGGFTAITQKGVVQQAVNEMNKARKNKVATRRQVLLGTNQYPNLSEKVEDKLTKSDAFSTCGCAEKDKSIIPAEDSYSVAAIDFSRGATEFEALRLAAEKSGKTPKVFMLTIGNLAMRLARSQFSANFFGCAGYEIINNLGFETIEEGVRAARDRKADIIVLCSSDDEYATFALEAFRLIDDKELFVVAGNPTCLDDLKAAGIEYFINLKSNVLETLRMFNHRIEKQSY